VGIHAVVGVGVQEERRTECPIPSNIVFGEGYIIGAKTRIFLVILIMVLAEYLSVRDGMILRLLLAISG
jgi:hypothetical protein